MRTAVSSLLGALVLLVAALFVPDGSTAVRAPTIIGTWRGTLVQRGYRPYLGIVRIYRRGSTLRGISYYPSLSCTGAIRGRQTGRITFLFTETITRGTNVCIASDRIRVALLSRASAVWVWFTGANHALAAATMSRSS